MRYWKLLKEDEESGKTRTLAIWRENEPPADFTKFEMPFSVTESDSDEYECFKGNPPLIAEYLHCCKESMYDTAAEHGLTDEQTQKLITALYEVKFLVDVTTGTIFAVNDKILGTAQDYEGPE